MLTADYTFVDERLAKHYGIPNVMGSRFRRVPVTDDNRKGLLGHAGILMLTSTAIRTSPVQRGKWVMEVLLGTPPPPAPPNVPALPENSEGRTGHVAKPLSVRERMEEHRANPACASCHKLMDPIGFALENFDAVGVWRTRDSGFLIDAAGQMFDGAKLNGPVSLRQALLSHSDAFLSTFTENLLAYGLGRVMTARGWLSTWSGLSSGAAVVDTIPSVTVPTLVVHATADTEIRLSQAKAIFEASGASDKTYVELPRVTHYLTGHRREAIDLIVDWLRARVP